MLLMTLSLACGQMGRFLMQDEVIPHLDPYMLPSTIDPDAVGVGDRGNRVPKKQVKLSAWKLAKLDSNDAIRAAAKARASSSILRPVDPSRNMVDLDHSSDGNASCRSSLSTDFGVNRETKTELRLSPLRSSYPQSQVSRDDYETRTQSMSSFSSPGHVADSIPLSPPVQLAPLPRIPPNVPAHLTNPMFQPIRKSSVMWDQEAGRYVSVAAPPPPRRESGWDTAVRNAAAAAHPSATIQTPEGTSYARAVIPPTARAAAPLHQPERVLYTGQSIFFGGPLLGAATSLSAETNSGGGDRRVSTAATTDSFPIFVPGSHEREHRSKLR